MRTEPKPSSVPHSSLLVAAAVLCLRTCSPAVEYIPELAGRLVQQLVDAATDDAEPEASSAPAVHDDGEPDEAAPAITEATSQPRQPQVDNFADPRPLRARLEGKVGRPLRLRMLVIHPGYASAEVQDPRIPEHVDRYTLRANNIDGPEPVKLVGRRVTTEELTMESFDITELDLGAIPKMVADALGRLKMADGKVSHVTCKRQLPFSSDVRCRVYVEGTRRNGSVDYDAKGRVVRVFD